MDPNEMTDETMGEGSPLPPSPDSGADEGPEPMGDNIICVPVAALAMPEEDDAMTPPAMGDKVQASIEGEVVSVKGEDAYVKLSAVNGQPVEDEAEPSDADEEASLQQQAASMPPIQ